METNENKVFGLNGVQLFFLSIFMIAILAYVMITIFGSLSSNSIIPQIGASNSTNFTYTTPTTFTAQEGITSSGVQVNQNGSHLNFDGGNDIVTTGLNINNSFFNQSLSISVWVKVLNNTVGPNEPIIWAADTAGDDRFYIRQSTTGIGGIRIGWGSYNPAFVNNISLNMWENYIISSNTTYIGFYRNGILVNSSEYINKFPNATIAISSASSSFKGDIDEVRIYNRSLSDTEITQIYNSGRIANSSLTSEGLVLWYKFDEANGTNVFDSSGMENHGQ